MVGINFVVSPVGAVVIVELSIVRLVVFVAIDTTVALLVNTSVVLSLLGAVVVV